MISDIRCLIIPHNPDDYTYWSSEPIAGNHAQYFENIPYLYSRPMPTSVEVDAVHSTSLALMVYLQYDLMTSSEPIMTWLQVMRSTDYGYAGTKVSRYEGINHIVGKIRPIYNKMPQTSTATYVYD